MKGYRSSYTPTSYALFAATGVLIPLGGYGFSGGLFYYPKRASHLNQALAPVFLPSKFHIAL